MSLFPLSTYCVLLSTFRSSETTLNPRRSTLQNKVLTKRHFPSITCLYRWLAQLCSFQYTVFRQEGSHRNPNPNVCHRCCRLGAFL